MSHPRSPLLLPALLLIGSVIASAQDMTPRLATATRRVYGEGATIARSSVQLDPSQVASIARQAGSPVSASFQYYVVRVGTSAVGYAIVDDVRGKTQPITYALYVGRDLVVKDLEVLVYREPYGGEVRYEAFRQQFRGATPQRQLRVGNDIRNISGATISSNAVTRGVKRLMSTLAALKSSGKLP